MLNKISTWIGKTATNITNKADDVREVILKGVKAGHEQVCKKRCCWCRSSWPLGDLNKVKGKEKTHLFCGDCLESITAVESTWSSTCKGGSEEHLVAVLDAIFIDAEQNPYQSRGGGFNDFILSAHEKHRHLFPNE